MTEKIGIVAGVIAFLGFSLVCTWHHLAQLETYSSVEAPPPATTTVPPIALPSLPPTPLIVESSGIEPPPGSAPQPVPEVTPPTPSNPTGQTAEEQSRQQIRSHTLRGKVVEFYAGSDILTPKGREALDTILSIVRDNPMTHLEIAGHTDNLGPENYNIALSQRRAEAVKNYFITRGVAEQHLVAQGYGSSLPIADNATAEGRQRNRRTEVIISPPLSRTELRGT